MVALSIGDRNIIFMGRSTASSSLLPPRVQGPYPSRDGGISNSYGLTVAPETSLPCEMLILGAGFLAFDMSPSWPVLRFRNAPSVGAAFSQRFEQLVTQTRHRHSPQPTAHGPQPTAHSHRGKAHAHRRALDRGAAGDLQIHHGGSEECLERAVQQLEQDLALTVLRPLTAGASASTAQCGGDSVGLRGALQRRAKNGAR